MKAALLVAGAMIALPFAPEAASAEDRSFDLDRPALREMLAAGDFARAISVLRIHSGAGNSAALVTLSMLCNSGYAAEGCADVDILDDLEIAAADGFAPAQFELARQLLKSPANSDKRSEALKLLHAAASQQHAPAIRLLGDVSAAFGTAEGFAAAAEHYRVAADLGDTVAHFRVAAIYETGAGVARDISKAIEHYEHAAERGNVLAQYALGRLYQSGAAGVTRPEAERLLRAASNAGFAPAQYQLASMLLSNEDAQTGYFEASRLLQKAARQNHLEAKALLGNLYYRGQGVRRDRERALALYEEAANAGHAGAQFELGRHFAEDFPTKALAWLEQAMAQNHPDAFYVAGQIYADGSEPDYVMADKLFATAARLGGGPAGSSASARERLEWGGASAEEMSRMAQKLRSIETQVSGGEVLVGAVILLAVIGALSDDGSSHNSSGWDAFEDSFRWIDGCPGFQAGGYGFACDGYSDVLLADIWVNG